MDVEGLLNLEDYVPPQGEKQIAPKPPKYPKYEMDPSSWQIDPKMSPPPAYDDLSIAMGPDEPLAIEAPPDEEEERNENEEEEDEGEANKILDNLELPNYDDVEKRLAQPEMTPTLQRNYLDKVIKDAEKRRRQVIAFKSHATIKFKKVKLMPRKEIEYIKILINFEESLMVPLNNINLKANQSKVMESEAREEEESTFTMMLKNYLTN